ncbi:MAG: ROK family protein [Deltaproteobacteria bacterium]|nr:ROK family protein [Deltaproteobacteria bacterium]
MGDKVIGIDIGGTNLRGALVDSQGNILKRMKILSEADQGIDKLIDNLTNFISDISKGEKVTNIGVGIPGILDSKEGIISQAPNILNVNDYPLRSVLNEKLGSALNVAIENDTNSAAVGEWWMGAAKDVNSMIMLTMGTGVGGGIVLDDKLWTGAYGMAGEIGHITIYPDGARCNCGNYGCLESYASATAIRRMVKEGLEDKKLNTALRETTENVHIKDIPKIVMEAAGAGDSFSLGIWQEVGKALGIAIASLVNLLNVEMVVIGGGVSNAWDLFIETTYKEAHRRAFRAPMKRAKIQRGILRDDAGILGSAYLALKSYNEKRS